MDLTGEERIAAPRDAVWVALNDPDTLKACIPGCQEIIRRSPTELDLTVKFKIGVVSATFSGEVTLSNLNPPESYTIAGEGKGNIAGLARGSADVRLIEDGAGTILAYDIHTKVGGKLAQFGSRLIGSSARKLATRFFADLEAKLNGRAT